MRTTPFLEMEPAVQTKSRKPFYAWIAIFGVPIWAAVFLVLMWQFLGPPLKGEPRVLAIAVMVIFGAAAAVCVALVLSYLLLPHRRGQYGIHRLGASLGGLTSMSLTVPVFGPLIQFQLESSVEAMRAINFPLVVQWKNIMLPYGACIEVVLIGMATGWMFVVVGSWLKAKRLRRI